LITETLLVLLVVLITQSQSADAEDHGVAFGARLVHRTDGYRRMPLSRSLSYRTFESEQLAVALRLLRPRSFDLMPYQHAARNWSSTSNGRYARRQVEKASIRYARPEVNARSRQASKAKASSTSALGTACLAGSTLDDDSLHSVIMSLTGRLRVGYSQCPVYPWRSFTASESRADTTFSAHPQADSTTIRGVLGIHDTLPSGVKCPVSR